MQCVSSTPGNSTNTRSLKEYKNIFTDGTFYWLLSPNIVKNSPAKIWISNQMVQTLVALLIHPE